MATFLQMSLVSRILSRSRDKYISAARFALQLHTSSPRAFIIKTFEDVQKEDMVRVMPSKSCESRRYLLRKDGLGFSFHETVLYPGKQLFIHYANHLEAVFVTKESGWLELVQNQDDFGKGKRFDLAPGTMYALNGHEKHFLGCNTDEPMHCICVFVPPCAGPEAQNENGQFPYIGDDGIPDYDFWATKAAKGESVQIELKPDS